MKWIKTKDKLPLNNQRVITRDENGLVTEFTYFDSLKKSWLLRINEWLEETTNLLCPTCKKGELYTKNGYIWCDNKKCNAIFEQQDTN